MSSRRGKRVLSREEHWLWTKVSSEYQPLKGRPLFLGAGLPTDLPPAVTATQQAQVEEKATEDKTFAALKPFHSDRKPSEHSRGVRNAVPQRNETAKLPPLAALERKALRSVRRGVKAVDGVLDLHGMRQSEAHYALLSFLRQSQARGASMVLIVTGKGDFDSGFHRGPDERGVLKRVVPQWLSMPDARTFVVSFGEAAQHHGGAGALYVRLRRHRA